MSKSVIQPKNDPEETTKVPTFRKAEAACPEDLREEQLYCYAGAKRDVNRDVGSNATLN